ncbi:MULTISPECIES: HAMP domain-containing sensor histidine kinase [unclassified Duganella]|uniref:sensor histidine kinase n=1 Tax=unclassified Duganella TaxID=2636909 RepID=UPI000886CBC9|nr:MULTISPECIES: HAMP domain-containing sensor histidine kinase [unclassified Duganella]SDG22940.1 Signal transduction histidine kinase [Duganella sp. OV458]SDJ25475.1 Signal transduction histidine kinase [Duganella sp. OV510]
MLKIRGSIVAKLVLGYGLLGIASIVAVSIVFYSGTIGVIDQNIDGKITEQTEHLLDNVADGGQAALRAEVKRLLSDGIDNDREIFQIVDADGAPVAGNLSSWPSLDEAPDMVTSDVLRNGRVAPARLYLRPLVLGGVLIVGRDLSEEEAVREVIWRALLAGACVSLMLTIAGAMLFRRSIEARLGEIRRTAAQIEAGDLSRRIPVTGSDEFALLNRDINRMLDRIELLMEGIRNVSNAIAHDLRTPLSRIRGRLDDALRHEATVPRLSSAAHDAIDDIDDLIRLFERLLQIAEAEAGMRARLFERLDLGRVVADIGEMYEAIAEDSEITLTVDAPASLYVDGDRNLLASAISSLIENAIKYAGAGAVIHVRAGLHHGEASISVHDNGPGIPAAERDKVTQRFYRVDKSRHLPGNGLGLSIVSATAKSHDGQLVLEDGAPGLIARIVLPLAPAS